MISRNFTRWVFLFASVLFVIPVELRCQASKASFFHPAVSPSGTIAFDSDFEGTSSIYVLDDNGDFTRISPKDVSCSHPAWSADGRFISYESNRDGDYDIYVYDFQTNNEQKLTVIDSTDAVSRWGPGGEILFESNRSGAFKIYKKIFNSQEEIKLLTEKAVKIIYPVPSPDGQKVMFSTIFEGDMELCIADYDFNHITRLTHQEGLDAWGGWSSDGKKVVFTSRRSGSNQIYMINIDGTALTQITIDTENSAMPSFLPDDSGIVFMSRQNGEPSNIYTIDLAGRVQRKLTGANR